MTGTRIQIGEYTTRRANPPTDLSAALDFWSFSGAAANVVMQLSWPEVGHGVVESRVESGALMKHPWKRARTTVQYLQVAILGTDDERAAYREAVNAAHRQVQSTTASPVKYNAFDRDLQMWVAACLFIGFEDTYQLLHGRLTADEAEQFYATAMPLATTLQVTEDQWPPTRADFEVYWNTACQRVRIDDEVRDYLMRLIGLKMVSPVLRWNFGRLLRFLTIGSLAPVFREAMRLPWSAAEQRRFENLFLFVSYVNTFLPKFVRQGASRLLMGDLRTRISKNKPLV